MPIVNGSSEAAGTARRSMADITRLFMNGAPAHAGSAPQRVGPQARANQPVRSPNGNGGATLPSAAAPMVIPPIIASSAAVARPTFSEARPRIAPVLQLAIVDPLGSQGQESLLEMAKLFAAEKECAVGVICGSGDTIKIFRADASRLPRFVGSSFAHPESPLDVQLARTLFGLREGMDAWIVAMPALENAMAERLCEAASDWLLFSGVDNDSLVGCYRSLKRARGMVGTIEDRNIRLFVRTLEPSQARRVHGRLEHVAKGFLDQPVELVNLDPRGGATLEQVTQFTSNQAAVTQSVWMSVVDFIHDISQPDEAEVELEEEETASEFMQGEGPSLESVLEPEERAALAFERVEAEAEPVATTELPAALPAELPMQAAPLEEPVAKPAPVVSVAPASSPVATTSGLTVAGLPQDVSDRAQLWDAINETLAGFHRDHTMLEARPPHEPAATLTVDQDGQIHLWTLANPGDLSSWSALFLWTQQHRELLALTRSDRAINATIAVQAHIVLPPDVARHVLPPANDSVRWYRSERISWNGQNGLVVVPQP